jgi:hypothetical protein
MCLRDFNVCSPENLMFLDLHLLKYDVLFHSILPKSLVILLLRHILLVIKIWTGYKLKYSYVVKKPFKHSHVTCHNFHDGTHVITDRPCFIYNTFCTA